MPIDRTLALAAEPRQSEISWDTRDVLLYHVSLGAGHGEDPQLRLTFERDLAVLPTFAQVAGQGISSGPRRTAEGLEVPGINVDLHRLLHAGQAVRVHRPLPAIGRAVVTSRITDVFDKGKAAVIALESSAASADDGEPLWTSTSQVWARGEGGFGGDPGPDSGPAAPDRPADLVVDTPTWPGQALLYRLNGDLNPLHADPEFAALAGLPKPIMHGLASYGIVARTVVEAFLGGDPNRLTGWSVRFAGMLTPGETLRTSIWSEAAIDTDGTHRLHVLATCPQRDDAPVLTHAIATTTAS